jgi:PBP1b-binding outer membrane lipoprotein LpoB
MKRPAQILFLAVLLSGCSDSAPKNTRPDRPPKEVQAYVTISVPGMT